MPILIKRQALRFAFSGLLVTGLHVLVVVAFIQVVLPAPPLANGVAFVVANFFSYLINTTWSFSKPLHGKSFIRFFLVSLIAFSLTIAISGAAQYYGLHYWYGIIFVVCTVPPITFLLHTFWTYR
ncbi:MAG: GtrA family protein [Candidatus Competibacteraceae bacterium]